MKKFLLLILPIIFFFVMNGFAQKSSHEALQKRINTLPDDTAKVYALIEYAVQLENIDLDSSAYYYRRAAALSDQSGFYMGKIKYALNYTVVLNMQGEMRKSKDLSQWALDLAMVKGDSLNMAKTHNNLGNAFNLMANFDSAFYHYLQAADLFSAIRREEYLHVLYRNISTVLHNLLQFDKAIEYNLKSIDYANRAGDSLQLSSSMVNLASIYSSIKKYDSAVNLLNVAVPYLEKTGQHYHLAAAYINLGNAQTKLNNYKKAIESYLKAIQHAKTLNDIQSLAIGYNGLAMVNFYLKNYLQADRYADHALRIIDSSKGEDLLQLLKLKAGIKSELGEHNEAYSYLLKYVNLNDSITGLHMRKNIAELEQKYQATKKDNEILQKQLLIEEGRDAIKRKNMWLWIAFLGTLLSGSLTILYYRFNKQKQKLHSKELLTLHQQQELERLQAGLEGQQSERKRIAAEMHDELGSGLTSILFMADGAMNNVRKVSENVPKIAEAARGVMNNMNEIIWSMNSEYDSLEDLIAFIRHHSVELLMQFDMPYRFHIPDEIPVVNIPGAHRRNIHLVVKEALHNIIKHAKASMVEIYFSFEDHLEILIADDGIGINEEELKRFRNGLKNMKHRMEAIGGTWHIENDNGTEIRLSLPLSV